MNFRWIGLGKGIRNYSLYVINDNLKRAKHVDHIIAYIQRTSDDREDIKEWEYVKHLNLSQANEAVKLSKFVGKNEKYPLISDKAHEIDKLYPATQNSFEWLILYPYSFAHMAVHITNSQLNRMTDDVTNEIQIMGSKEELEHAAFDALTIFLGLLEDYARIFRTKTDLKEYWDQVLRAKI